MAIFDVIEKNAVVEVVAPSYTTAATYDKVSIAVGLNNNPVIHVHNATGANMRRPLEQSQGNKASIT